MPLDANVIEQIKDALRSSIRNLEGQYDVVIDWYATIIDADDEHEVR